MKPVLEQYTQWAPALIRKDSQGLEGWLRAEDHLLLCMCTAIAHKMLFEIGSHCISLTNLEFDM